MTNTTRWNKKMCIEYMTAGKSRLEEIMQENQMPSALQKLMAMPREIKVNTNDNIRAS